MTLDEPHRVALEQAGQWLRTIVDPVGIVVTGSVVRGNPGPASDLDIVVLQDRPSRRRIQRRFNGTPVELFINSEAWLRHSVESEVASGRPVMTHMLATGHLLCDTAGRMAALVNRSSVVLDAGPRFSPDALTRDRYMAASQVEDVLDFEGVDGPDARRLLALAVDGLVRHAYLYRNLFLPRPKERQKLLAALDPALAALLASALSGAFAQATAALRAAAEHALGTSGFFEWDSGDDETPPPQSA